MKAVPIDIAWHPEMSVYSSPGFLATVSDKYGWIAGLDDAGERRFILPYTLVKRAGIRMIRFRVETMAPDPYGSGTDEEKLFLNDAMRVFASFGADVVIPASTNTLFRTYPDSAVAVPYGSYIVDLSQPEEQLWNQVHSKHRNVIRNAQKKGVTVVSSLEHAPAAYQLIAETFRRSAMPFMDYRAFQRMVSGLGELVRVFVAFHGSDIQGCAVIPFSTHSAYYAYGGTIATPVTGATNLLQWEAFRHFRGLGVKRYDFCGARIDPDEGSKAAGLTMYKERFGGTLARGYMWKCALRPVTASVYGWAVRLLRGGDIVDQERRRQARRNQLASAGAAPQAASPEESHIQ